jgi:hypothetical protein
MSDNTPTERFDAQSASAPAGEAGRSGKLLYVLIGIGVLLLIVVVILVATLLSRPGATTPNLTPSPSQTDSATPTPTPTLASPSPEPEDEEEPPPPPVPVPGFDSFSAPSDAGCEDGDSSRPLTFSWSSDDAVTAYIGVQTNNAKSAPYEGDLPPVYTYTNLNYQCDHDSQYYTVTLEDGAGHLTHKTVTINK